MIKDATDGEYSLVDFSSRTKPFTVKHRTCGTVTEITRPTEVFLNCCALCKVVIDDEELGRLMEEATGGKAKLLKQLYNKVEYEYDGKIWKELRDRVVSELIRESPSKLFPDRVKQARLPESKRAMLYMKVVEKDDGGRSAAE